MEKDEEVTEEEEPKKCQSKFLSGDKKGQICNKPAKYPGEKCGIHRSKKGKEKEVSVGASSERKLDVIELSDKVYVCNVKNSSKDTAAWKTFWITHTKLEYPKVCRAKDCAKTATATGHMYLRTEYEASKELPKHNYLVPICSHHNSSKYDTEFFLVKKTTVAVKILENKSIHK